MSTNQEIINNEPFIIFKTTNIACNGLYKSMDSMPTINQTDSESSVICCGCLVGLFCWPLTLLYDILSCPFRGCIHCKNSRK
jgi:hypothetical protein